jgi:predicted aconitase
MILTDEEQAVLDGAGGAARRRAMGLLVDYGRILGAVRLVKTASVAGVPGQATPFLRSYFEPQGGQAAIFPRFDLDADELFDVPMALTGTACLQSGTDPRNWAALGKSEAAFVASRDGEAYAAERGVQMLRTCTPYIAGLEPKFGDHCAWMESSAVIYANSVLGARTNTEGRHSTSAAMLVGRIPYWGLHCPENRFASHHVRIDTSVESVRDWGMLGYFVGETVGEAIPAIDGALAGAELTRLKHFGAAAASSGGVELYHLVGITPEAPTLDAAFGSRVRPEPIVYDARERRRIWEVLNANGDDENVDFVMLGCPHAAIEQMREIAAMLDGKRVTARLWVFTSRHVRDQAQAEGIVETIRRAGAMVFTDTCSAIGQAVPPDTKVVALDSAKQTHYLPAMMGVQAWFGTTAECIDAAVSGRWRGEAP